MKEGPDIALLGSLIGDPDVLKRLSRLAPTKGHPYTFYQKAGFTVVGVVPDADGFGKHDILMAKKVGGVPGNLSS